MIASSTEPDPSTSGTLHVQEPAPDTLYQAPAPGWQVGDLVRQTGKLILIIAVGAERQHQGVDNSGELILVRTYRELICLDETGSCWQADGPTERVDFLHNTELLYDYQNREQVKRDYWNGFFTPYFDIL